MAKGSTRGKSEVIAHLERVTPKVTSRQMFSKVRVAQELLREKASELLEEYLDVVQKAKDAGDYETAAKSLQWLIEHMPPDMDGERVVAQSVDKKQEVVQGPVGPAIQIGIQVGGAGQKKLPISKPKELPTVTAEIVDE